MQILSCSLFLVVTFLLFQQKVPACSCSAPDIYGTSRTKVTHAREDAPVVFSGEVLEISNSLGVDGKARGLLSVKFRVQRMWKGTSTKTILIKTERGSGMCGYPFKIGRSYLVYTIGIDPRLKDFATKEELTELRTNICSRTKEISLAKEDVRYLGEISKR